MFLLEISSGGILSGGILSGGILERGDIVRGDFVLGGYCPGGYCPGDIVRGDIVRGDIVLEPNKHYSYPNILETGSDFLVGQFSTYKVILSYTKNGFGQQPHI